MKAASRWRSAVVAAHLLLLAAMPVARADDVITHLRTRSGAVDVREAGGPDCRAGATAAERCTALFVNGRKLVSDNYVLIKRVFPSKDDPALLYVYATTGGNLCCGEDYVLDLTRTPPLMLKGLSFGADISRAQNKVTFRMMGGEDALGDRLRETYTYVLGSGRPVRVLSSPDYSTAPLEDVSTAFDLLRNPVLRAPLLSVVGRGHFKEFRRGMIAADPLRKIGDYVIGSGCQPHACDWHFALFVLDAADRLAWAAEAFEGPDATKSRAKVWGVLTAADALPRREIQGWLAERHVPEGAVTFAPLPAEVAEGYPQPRQASEAGPPRP